MSLMYEKTIEKLFFLAACVSGLITFFILIFLLIPAIPLFSGGHFFSILTDPWNPSLGEFGIYPMIAGTLSITMLTMVFAFPLSLGCAMLISIGNQSIFTRLLRKIVEMMTGIPSVVYGFVGIALLVPLVRDISNVGSGMSVLAAALMLTLLVSPTMILLFYDSFLRVPPSYGNAILAVGGTEAQKFLHVTLPNSWSGIIVGFTLALGRVLGDTMIALMIAGNAVQVPGSLFDAVRALTSHIALVFATDYHSPEFQAIFVCAVFLYLFSATLAIAVRFIHDRQKITVPTKPLLKVSQARLLEKIIPLFSRACGVVLLAAVGSVLGFLFIGGWHSLNLQLIFGTVPPLEALLFKRPVFNGLFPAIVGTLSLVVLAVCWSIPVGIAAGIYLAEYATGKTKQILNLLFDILAGLPSIVVGLFGFSITILLNKHFSDRIYPSLLISSILLAFLVLPYIIRTTQAALEGLPASLRMTALALGANKLQNIMKVLLPQSRSGISSGVILATGRCAEDTAVIMLTGVVAFAGVPRSLLLQYEALPFYIFYISSQYSDQAELETAYGAAIILLSICLILFSLAFIIKKQANYSAHFRL